MGPNASVAWEVGDGVGSGVMSIGAGPFNGTMSLRRPIGRIVEDLVRAVDELKNEFGIRSCGTSVLTS